MHRFATPLLVSTLAAAALAAPTAASAAEELPLAYPGPIDFPEDARNYSNLGGIFSRPGYFAADGRLAWLFSRQRTSDDGRAIGTVTTELPVFGSSTPRIGIRWGTLAGSTALRSSVGDTTAPVTAVGGGTWFLDRPLTPRPARARLVRFDDRGVVVQRIAIPRGITPTIVVPTSRGLRVVGVKTIKEKKRTDQRIVISGPGVRGWAVDPYLTWYERTVAAPLPDGSLLVSGRSRADLPEPVLRVSPSGKVSRLADRRSPSAATLTATAGFVPTRLGVAMVESSGTGGTAADLKDAIVIRGSRGEVVTRKYFRDAALGLPGLCARQDVNRSIQLLTGPDGLPVLSVVCRAYDTTTYRTVGAHFLVGLGEDLLARWTQNITLVTTNASPQYSYSDPCAGTQAVGADQRIWTVSCYGTYGSTPVPGVAPAPLGKITSSKRDGKAGAVVRIRCEGSYGTICTGVAAVTVAGKVVAQVPYLLPARPGKAASTLDRHIPTSAPLQGRFATDLRPRA